MDYRFSRVNIVNTVHVHRYSKVKRFILQNIVGFLIEFGFFFFAILLFGVCLIFEFNINILNLAFFLVLTFALYFVYLFFIKYYQIKVNNYTIEVRGIKKPVSFVFVSDMHIGNERVGSNYKRTKSLVEKINKLNTDLVVFGGDFVNMDYDMEILKILKEIKAKQKIGVYGNHDSLYLKEFQQDDEATDGVMKLESLDINILNNEGLVLNLNNEKIYFGGITDLYSLNFDITKAFENAKTDLPRILISHNPDIIDFIQDEDNIDLILSGHTHAGQILLPIIGPILPMPNKYRWLTKGLFQIGEKTKLFVSQGAGFSGTRIRIGTDCEICLITILPLRE